MWSVIHHSESNIFIRKKVNKIVTVGNGSKIKGIYCTSAIKLNMYDVIHQSINH